MNIVVWFVSAAMALAAPTAEKRADLGGNWALVPDKSEMEQVAPGIRNLHIDAGPVTIAKDDPPPLPAPSPAGFMSDLRLEITQTEDRIRIVRRYTLDGERGTVTQEFAFDGSRCLNLGSDGRGEYESRTEWKKGKLLTAGIQSIATGHGRVEHNVREEFSLSRDRKTLTVKTLIATPEGMVKLKQVFIPDREP